MFIFGHLGIGNQLATPWSRRLPKFPLFLGMLLPDIIDKTLYYGHFFDWVTCTRTFGHSGAFLLAIVIAATLSRTRWLGALALGMATHVLLDCLIDRFYPQLPSSALIALEWPFLTHQFAIYHFNSISEHLEHLINAPILISEGIGLSLLGWAYWKSSHRRLIRQVLFSKYWRGLKRRRLERD